MQFGHILAKSLTPTRRQADPRSRFLADKVFFDLYVVGAFQGAKMRAKIAVSGVDNAAQRHKIQPLSRAKRIQRGHDLQAYRLMNQIVGRLHQQPTGSHPS